MVVCICHAITDRTLERAASDGAATVDELCARTGAGTDCGACLPALAELARSCRPEGCDGCPRRATMRAGEDADEGRREGHRPLERAAHA